MRCSAPLPPSRFCFVTFDTISVRRRASTGVCRRSSRRCPCRRARPKEAVPGSAGSKIIRATRAYGGGGEVPCGDTVVEQNVELGVGTSFGLREAVEGPNCGNEATSGPEEPRQRRVSGRRRHRGRRGTHPALRPQFQEIGESMRGKSMLLRMPTMLYEMRASTTDLARRRVEGISANARETRARGAADMLRTSDQAVADRPNSELVQEAVELKKKIQRGS